MIAPYIVEEYCGAFWIHERRVRVAFGKYELGKRVLEESFTTREAAQDKANTLANIRSNQY